MTEKPRSTNLFLIGGIWDIIFWKAVAYTTTQLLSGDCLIFSKAFNQSKVEEIKKFAISIGLSPLPDHYSCPKDINKLHKYDTIYTIHLADSFIRKICTHFDNAKLVIGFEGMGGYFPNIQTQKLITRSFYYFHYSDLPVPAWVEGNPCTHISAHDLRKSISDITSKITTEPFKINSNTILVLGQHFHRHGVISWQNEHDIYRDFIHAKVRQGFNIIWKEHPRNTPPFFSSLQANQPGSIFELNFDPILAIELWGPYLVGLEMAAGISSNSLFNLQYIFGIKAQSILSVETMARFRFDSLNKSALINLISLGHLNHDKRLPIEIITAALQKKIPESKPLKATKSVGEKFKKIFSIIKLDSFK